MKEKKILLWIRKKLKTAPVLGSTILLLSILFVLFLLDSNDRSNIISNLISGTSTEIIGAIITLWVVQLLFDKHKTSLEEKEERKKILNLDKILSIFIRQYEILLYITINDYGKDREKLSKYSLCEDFDITQLQYAHNECLLLNKAFYCSNIHYFLKTELELQKIIISSLQNIDFRYHNEIYKRLYGYVETSIAYDIRDAIKQNDEIIKKERAQKSHNHLNNIKNLITNHIKNYNPQKQPSNLMYSYFLLYEMINIEKKYLCEYRTLVESLKNRENP